ncbi:hypothetical protein A2U01_0104861, partial [Trifolium medium]|nr:hypothetical protein [Trifolium medium]
SPSVWPPLSGRLSIQGAGQTLRRTIGSDIIVESRGNSQGIIHIRLKQPHK